MCCDGIIGPLPDAHKILSVTTGKRDGRRGEHKTISVVRRCVFRVVGIIVRNVCMGKTQLSIAPADANTMGQIKPRVSMGNNKHACKEHVPHKSELQRHTSEIARHMELCM